MEHNFVSYNVEIKNLKYITDDGRKFPKTAIVTFLDKDGLETGTELFGNIDIAEIYLRIHEGSELNFNNCYLQDFDINSYRQHFGLENKAMINLSGFSASYSFFESHPLTDFSYCDFGDADVNFESVWFGKGKVSFRNCVFGKGDVNFSGVFAKEGDLDFGGTVCGDGDFIFKNAFLGPGIKDFQDMRFGSGEVTFANTEFSSGELLFINTQFGEGKFSFKIARVLSGKIDFHYASFGKGDVVFERVEFGDSRVDFRAVDFGEGRVNFNRSVFGNSDLNFEGATFKGNRFFFKRVSIASANKNFSLMEMPKADLSFEKTDFGTGGISFNSVKCKTLSLQSCHLDYYCDLRLGGAEMLDLSDSIVRDIIDLEPYNVNVELDIINMSGMRLLGKLYMDWQRNNCKSAILNQELTDLRQKAEQFRILKENFNVTGKYDDEDLAYVMFKRLEAKAGLQESRKSKKGLKYFSDYISYLARWLIFDAAGQYATNPIRVLISMVMSYVFFSVIYLLMMLFTNANIIASVDDKLSMVAKAFYHSAVTFLTIGYGDHYPYGSIRWMSGIEGFVGLFLMSYFTVAFVRKILR